MATICQRICYKHSFCYARDHNSFDIQRHLRYLKKHRRVRYANLLTSGELNAYLADIDRQAEALFLRLVKQMADAEGITETLKASDQMEWVRRMNSCRDRASETVYHQVIYT